MKALLYQSFAVPAFRLAGKITGEYRRSVAVFMAHGLHNNEMTGFGIPPASSMSFDTFARTVNALRRSFCIISLREAVAMISGQSPWRERCVVLTFDDSLRCLRTLAAPWLAQSGLPAIFFISTDAVETRTPYWWLRLDYAVLHARVPKPVSISLSTGETFQVAPSKDPSSTRQLKFALFEVPAVERDQVVRSIEAGLEICLPLEPEKYPYAATMTWEDVKELHRLGMEIGGHTASHPNLALLDAVELQRELGESKAKIETKCAEACAFLSYPHGLYTAQAIKVARVCGYQGAVTTRTPGWNNQQNDLFELNRFSLPRKRGKIFALLSGVGAFKKAESDLVQIRN